jgi:hypothetical protein
MMLKWRKHGVSMTLELSCFVVVYGFKRLTEGCSVYGKAM